MSTTRIFVYPSLWGTKLWHKEIIYALLSGTVVFWPASMGALRAAEPRRAGEEYDSLVALHATRVTYKAFSESRIGKKQKASDALEALQFARSYRGKVKTILSKESIREHI